MIDVVHRRRFLRDAATMSAAMAWGSFPKAWYQAPAAAARRRTFEITTRIEIRQPSGPTRVWVPTPLAVAPYQETLGDTYHLGEHGRSVMVENEDVDMLGRRMAGRRGAGADVDEPRRHHADTRPISLRRRCAPPLDLDVFARFLRPTRLIPTDGIVKETADRDHARRRDRPREGARHLRLDRRQHVPRSEDDRLRHRRHPLHAGVEEPGGKCADLNALFVGLARASGMPARDVCGLRVAKSESGLRSLGLSSDNASKAQHCRAEVYLVGYGWVPVDPADVRKVVLDEPPGNLPLSDERVRDARARLFGSWEMNWIAYNVAHDVTLPGSKHGRSCRISCTRKAKPPTAVSIASTRSRSATRSPSAKRHRAQLPCSLLAESSSTSERHKGWR